MRKEFTSDLKQTFFNHKKKNHIHLDMVYFINGTDKNDKELQHMTDRVVTFAMKQPSWGQPRPMQWVPLELQISNIRMQNVYIITKDDLRNVNKLNNDLALTGPQLDDFLLFQHSLGKLMHYNIRGLDNFIIIHPPVLVNILRSFVTDEMFFPNEGCLESILKTLTETGKIYKTDLLKLWERNEYMLNDAIKEFVIELLVYLNILIIPETYRYNRFTAELFIVPSMIKTIKPSNFIDFENQREKTICLKYVLSQQSIPSSLAYTIIGTTLNVWPLKEKENMSCIYHKAAILNVVDDNELRLWIEDDMIELYITNQTSIFAISPDILASIQECLTRNLESTLEFYYKSFGGQFKHSKLAELFSMKVGIPCGNSVCYISLEKAKTVDSWKCENNEEHSTSSLLNWIFNRVTDPCKPECKGKTNKELGILPSDKHLVRVGKYFEYDSFEDLIIRLGMKKLTLQNIEDRYHNFGRGGIKSIALIQWRESKLAAKEKPTLKSLSDAMVTMESDNHLMCQRVAAHKEESPLQSINEKDNHADD
ncbi:uncharacterized protein [Mytilus edulis]|uniref:uncharacterized protein n=1 Tax=Mytilus edulis TaxID=6550 RepID=UPI0039F0B062